MDLITTSYIDHRNSCGQNILSLRIIEGHMLVPGASTCCAGSSSTSCCSCGALTDGLIETIGDNQ